MNDFKSTTVRIDKHYSECVTIINRIKATVRLYIDRRKHL